MTKNATSGSVLPRGTLSPPAGRPNWAGCGDVPLIYLGWGERDFATDPLPQHTDPGTNYFVLLRGAVVMSSGVTTRTLRAPVALVVGAGCPFGVRQARVNPVEILVWVWQGLPELPGLMAGSHACSVLSLTPGSLDLLRQVHVQCRKEVSMGDTVMGATLGALRTLMEAELLRASRPTPVAAEARWQLIRSWLGRNLALRPAIPSLCDYLGMSPSTLTRFFLARTGTTPGEYLRLLKLEEARRLIEREGWQVKAAAYHLGYKHPNDLSRALRRGGPRAKAHGRSEIVIPQAHR